MSNRMKCSKCNKVMNRSDNLKRHERICMLKNRLLEKKKQVSPRDHSLFDKIINGTHGSQPTKTKDDEVINVNLPDLSVSSIPKPEVKELIVQSNTPTHFLPSSEDGLKEKLRLLYAEFLAGNTATKPLIFEILNKLCKRGIINGVERDSLCHVIENSTESPSSSNGVERDSLCHVIVNSTESPSSSNDDDDSTIECSDESEIDETEGLDFNELVNATAENLTRNTRRNLHKALRLMDKNISTIVNNYINGEEEFENVMEKLGKSSDGIKVKMLLRDIETTRERVAKVLKALRETEEGGKGKVLEQLRMNDQISDHEHHRLLTSANDILSYAKAIQGCGFWV